VLNCAVEESTLRGRVDSSGRLTRAHDAFVARACGRVAGDVLIVSVGGNDVVLSPTARTAASLALCLCASGGALDSGRAC
jgi:hypothetical protein